MYCSKCSNKLNKNAEFCTKCGKKVEKNSNAFINNVEKKNSRKKLVIIISILIFIIICFIFVFFFSSSNLSWNESYDIYHNDFISPAKIKLGINFDDTDKLNDIKFSSNCGTVERNGFEFDWDLSDSKGKCKLTISYKLRKISKEYSLFDYYPESKLSLDYEIDYDSNDDLDLDSLTNAEEKKYKTNPEFSDSDFDNLFDYYEIFTSKTDPNKFDSDGDGLSDYDEIELDFDPLKKDSKNDGIEDGKRVVNYDFTQNNVKLSISGSGNVASSSVVVNSNTKIGNKPGIVDNIYSIYSDANVKSMTVSISYTGNDLKKYGFNEGNLSLYNYDFEKSEYKKINTTVDKKNKLLIASVEPNKHYVIGDTSLASGVINTEVLFILDNSWSMYSNEQYKKITGKDYKGGLFESSILPGYDESGVRFTLTSDLITKLSKKNFKIGLSEFRSDYSNALKIGSDENVLKAKLNDMNGKFITSVQGTDISNALTNGINEFSNDSDYKYIVILTDGQDSSLKKNTDNIINTAINNDVSICSIGFGGGSLNDQLAVISQKTGCRFYSSGNADGLNELFDNIGSELNDGLVDIGGDEDTDGFIIADSGFLVNKDGFSFANYGTNLSPGGHCYGMALFAQLYYQKILPLKFDSISADEDKSYAYNLNNTYFKNYANLYEYRLKTNGFKYSSFFGYEYFDEENPADFYVLNKDTLSYNDVYKTEINSLGFYDIIKDETELSKKEQINRYGFNYKFYEDLLINEDKMQSSKVVVKDDKELFNAIYAGFIKQNVTTHYSSGINFIVLARDIYGSESIEYKDGYGFIEILANRLNNGDAPVMVSTYSKSGGVHAINAINLVQDFNKPNYYHIGVYDNNYPGEKKYVTIKCKKSGCSTEANEYYSASNQPIRISFSLEEDLKYFNK